MGDCSAFSATMFKGVSTKKSKMKYDDVIDKVRDLTDILPRLFKNRLNIVPAVKLRSLKSN